VQLTVNVLAEPVTVVVQPAVMVTDTLKVAVRVAASAMPLPAAKTPATPQNSITAELYRRSIYLVLVPGPAMHPQSAVAQHKITQPNASRRFRVPAIAGAALMAI
jgi:hypothetical protein